MIKQKDLIIKLLTVLFPDAKIYLFGSRARGTYKENSDIDLAIDSKIPLTSLDIVKALNVLEAVNVPYSVDIVDMKKIPDYLRETILKEGILWKD